MKVSGTVQTENPSPVLFAMGRPIDFRGSIKSFSLSSIQVLMRVVQQDSEQQ